MVIHTPICVKITFQSLSVFQLLARSLIPHLSTRCPQYTALPMQTSGLSPVSLDLPPDIPAAPILALFPSMFSRRYYFHRLACPSLFRVNLHIFASFSFTQRYALPLSFDTAVGQNEGLNICACKCLIWDQKHLYNYTGLKYISTLQPNATCEQLYL